MHGLMGGEMAQTRVVEKHKYVLWEEYSKKDYGKMGFGDSVEREPWRILNEEG